jgi:hypothetical protein
MDNITAPNIEFFANQDFTVFPHEKQKGMKINGTLYTLKLQLRIFFHVKFLKFTKALNFTSQGSSIFRFQEFLVNILSQLATQLHVKVDGVFGGRGHDTIAALSCGGPSRRLF